MAKLSAASDAAREGSIEALRAQQHRLSLPAPPNSSPYNASPYDASPYDAAPYDAPRYASPQRALPAPKRASTVIAAPAGGGDYDPLFCRYALGLQLRPSKALAGDFAPGGDCRCPECDCKIDAAADDVWLVGKRAAGSGSGSGSGYGHRDGYGGREAETRQFRIGQPFVIKSHTPDGMYACVLCSRHRERDAVCRTVEALVEHVARFHDVEELEREVDIGEGVPR